jgi:hypothetical protein
VEQPSRGRRVRSSIAPPGAPFYQVWAAPLVLAAIGITGAAYLLIARPHRKLGSTGDRPSAVVPA